MDPFAAFCSELLTDGRVVFHDPPPAAVPASPGAVEELARAFAAVSRGVAGPPIAFDPHVAVQAAGLVRHACWAAVCHAEPADVIRGRLAMSQPPANASHHLSADLTFRYLPQVLRRVRAYASADPLVEILSDVLRHWPLSGVLADLREPPAGPLDFGGHEGLMLLYAERLARHERPAWVPAGRPGEYAALVFQELGRPLPARPGEVLGYV
jgi:hypothetical protein